METYTPQVIDEQTISVAIKYSKCPICQKNMVSGLRNQYGGHPFPVGQNKLGSQIERIGFVFSSDTTDKNNEVICVECSQAGLSSFVCFLCKEERTSNECKDTYGEPPEYLCHRCHETVTAKVYDQARDTLYAKHKYDFT